MSLQEYNNENHTEKLEYRWKFSVELKGINILE